LGRSSSIWLKRWHCDLAVVRDESLNVLLSHQAIAASVDVSHPAGAAIAFECAKSEPRSVSYFLEGHQESWWAIVGTVGAWACHISYYR
jgi:hypothetical protein